MSALRAPPARGLTIPMEATLPSAESRACTSGIKSGSGKSPTEPCGWRACTLSRTSRRMAISSALSTGSFLAPAPCSRDHGRQTAARREFSHDCRAHGFRGFHHVAEHAVHRVFLEDSEVAIGQQIHLVGLQLEAEPVGHVAQNNPTEIGQSCLRADGSELGHHDLNFVIPVLVRPCFDFRELGVDACGGVLVGIGALHARAFESRSRNKPTSATTPTACPVPRSLTLVATAGLMSTQTIFTQLGSMLPVAMECSMVPRHSTSPAPLSCSA